MLSLRISICLVVLLLCLGMADLSPVTAAAGCDEATNCNGNGFCRSDGRCLCYPPYYGLNCSKRMNYSVYIHTYIHTYIRTLHIHTHIHLLIYLLHNIHCNAILHTSRTRHIHTYIHIYIYIYYILYTSMLH